MTNKIWPHAKEESWWDGPERFKFINRAEVSMIQTETLVRTITTLLGINGIDAGGPTGGHLIQSVNIDNNSGADRIADASALPYADGCLDYVFSSHTLEHIPNTQQVLKEWLRIIKPCGYIIIVMPDRRLHLHDPTCKRLGEWAPSEMTPDELLEIVDKLDVDVLSFNTRNNNFDFEMILRKR